MHSTTTFLCIATFNCAVFVSFRWAQLPSDGPAVHKAVVNVGDRPTLDDGRAATVEVHVMHTFDRDEFYGETLNVVLSGFLRYVIDV